MNKAFEKILDMLEEERELSYADFSRYVEEVSPCLDDEYDDFFHRGLERASRLVKEVAEEYNGGWIPCSERLPDIEADVLLTLRSLDIYTGFRANTDGYFYVEGTDDCYVPFDNVIAWQPLPEPFKEREANG